MTNSDAPSLRLSGRARSEAGLALLPAVAAAAWLSINSPDFTGLYGICVILIAAPVLATSRRVFARAGVTIAVILLIFSVLGDFFGLFLFLPSAVVLFAAALAARYPRAKTAARFIAWLLALGVLLPWGLAFHHYFFPPSNIVIVQESAPESVSPWSLLDLIHTAGFTGAEVTTWTSDRQLVIEPAKPLGRQDRQRLLDLARSEPGVVTAHWCRGTQCHG